MRSKKDVRKELESSKKQQQTSIMEDADVFYGAYQQALIWVLGG